MAREPPTVGPRMTDRIEAPGEMIAAVAIDP